MGCVSYSLKYFPDGRIDKAAHEGAPSSPRARSSPASCAPTARPAGTRRWLPRAPRARSRTSCARTASPTEGLTRDGLEQLRIAADQAREAPIPTASPACGRTARRCCRAASRSCSAVFDELGLEAMKVSDGALRHGVLYDLLGRVAAPRHARGDGGAVHAPLPRRRGAGRARASSSRSRSTTRSRRAPSARTTPTA